MSEEFTDVEFDPSERRELRKTMSIVKGNGKPGLGERIRRIEWISRILVAGVSSLIAGVGFLVLEAIRSFWLK